MKINEIYNMDCAKGIEQLIETNQKVDLIVTDPPYLLKNLEHNSNSNLGRSIRKYKQELIDNGLTKGISNSLFKLFWDVVKKPNFYFFCNRAQIQQYLDFFVNQNKCAWEMLIWNKTNVPPFYNNKYLNDKEYILHFHKGVICHPKNYQNAKTVYISPTNKEDKTLYGHPTIKPLGIVKTLVENSSYEGDTVLDPFMGSGTTAVAAKQLNRNYIGFEINKEFYEASQKRLASN